MFGARFAQQREGFSGQGGIEISRRLIGQDEFRPVGKRTRHCDALLLADESWRG